MKSILRCPIGHLKKKLVCIDNYDYQIFITENVYIRYKINFEVTHFGYFYLICSPLMWKCHRYFFPFRVEFILQVQFFFPQSLVFVFVQFSFFCRLIVQGIYLNYFLYLQHCHIIRELIRYAPSGHYSITICHYIYKKIHIFLNYDF